MPAEILGVRTYVQRYYFGCGISKMVGSNKQDLWLKITMLKGNHCILWKQVMTVRQKVSKSYFKNEVLGTNLKVHGTKI